MFNVGESVTDMGLKVINPQHQKGLEGTRFLKAISLKKKKQWVGRRQSHRFPHFPHKGLSHKYTHP